MSVHTNPTKRKKGSFKDAVRLWCKECGEMRMVSETSSETTQPMAWLSPCGHVRTAELGDAR